MIRVYNGVLIPRWMATDHDFCTVRQTIAVSKVRHAMNMIQVLLYPGKVAHPVNGGTLGKVDPFAKEYDERTT